MSFKRIYTSEDRLMVGHVRNLLEAEGIPCRMKNEFLTGGIGELPPHECWPELWVDEHDTRRAEQVVAKVLHSVTHLPSDWTCPTCGERIEGQFGECWRCAQTDEED